MVEEWKNVLAGMEQLQLFHNHQPPRYVALFLHCFGPEALKIYNIMQFANETERKTLSKIVEKFDEFAIGEVNETYEP